MLTALRFPVSTLFKEHPKGTTSDFDGKYSIEVNADAVLVFSYIGFEQQEISVNGKSEIDVTMASGLQLSEVQIVGSRNPERTSTDTAVPVDIINVAEVSTQSGQLEVNQLLQYAVPSFTPTSNLVLMVQIMLILHRCGVWDQIKPWF